MAWAFSDWTFCVERRARCVRLVATNTNTGLVVYGEWIGNRVEPAIYATRLVPGVEGYVDAFLGSVRHITCGPAATTSKLKE